MSAFNMTLGQYIPGNTCIHRLDPRTKILSMILFILLVFFVDRIELFVFPVLLLVMMFVLAKVPVSYLGSSLKPMRILLIFMFLINLFFTPGKTVLFSWKFITVTKEAVRQAIFISIRLVLLISGTSMLTLTTSPLALTDGLERMMSPLKVFHFPAHELAMMMTIALRFIPTLMEETERIQKAQMARGADCESGNLIARAKAMIPILVPLFVSAFRRADELAIAMESRCYHGGEGRTRMTQLHFQIGDLIAVLILTAFLVLCLVL